MKTILLYMFLILSTTIVGQTVPKYIVETTGKSSDPNELIRVTPKNYYTIIHQFTHGKTHGGKEGMVVGNRNYWTATLFSLRERFFTEKQLALFKEKKFNLYVYMYTDNAGNVKCIRLLASRGILDTISKKQLDSVYQALWKLKPPMNREWSDQYYYDGKIRLISSFGY